MSVWNPLIPQPEESPAGSQPEILANFINYPIVFSEDHVAMNVVNQGKHTDVHFKRQTTDPIVNGNWISIFDKQANQAAAAGLIDQLFTKCPAFIPGASNLPVQWTYNTVNLTGPNDYQSFLPNGYIIYFGIRTMVGIIPPMGLTITLTPTASKIIFVSVTNSTVMKLFAGGTAFSATAGASSITVYGGVGGLAVNQFNYLAIGQQ